VDVPVSSIVIQLSMTVVFPLILGQTLRKTLKIWLDRKHIPLGSIGR
jgi:sodium/bile acid cotransporter 7